MRSAKRIKLGVFFSHPTQHHSPLFSKLSEHPQIDVQVYYYDPQEGMHDPGFGVTESWDIDLAAGTRSKILHNVLRGKSVSATHQFNPGIMTAFLRQRFDAVFISGYAAPSNWLVLLLAKLFRVHILYQSDTNILDEKRKPRSRFGRWLRHFFLSQMDTLLIAGDKNKEFYLLHELPEEKMVWCPIPVDVARFVYACQDHESSQIHEEIRANLLIPPEARVVIFSGKLIERKRPSDVIEAIRQISHLKVYCLILGSGPLEEELRASLEASDRVRLAGFVNQQVMPYFVQLADVAVVPSEWDPHPLVTTEFAACGLPIIVSHYTGVWGDHDILRPNENGFVYPCGDTTALASYLEQLLTDESMHLSMSERSRELAQEQSIEHVAAIIVARLLEQIPNSSLERRAEIK